ncbi:hypothetical protein EON65_53510 [archaeon]|nr:MAG: hypothetical protein EON65_53510 [archaeon]
MSYIDIQFEEEIRRNPYSAKTWWNYAHAKADESSRLERFSVYERALGYLPRSYKLWHAYLNDRVFHLRNTPINSKKYDLLIDVYERALVFMGKMPRIWYISFSISLSLVPIPPPLLFCPNSVWCLGWITAS